MQGSAHYVIIVQGGKAVNYDVASVFRGMENSWCCCGDVYKIIFVQPIVSFPWGNLVKKYIIFFPSSMLVYRTLAC